MKRIALHETPFSSEHIMRTYIGLYDPLELNRKSGLLL